MVAPTRSIQQQDRSWSSPKPPRVLAPPYAWSLRWHPLWATTRVLPAEHSIVAHVPEERSEVRILWSPAICLMPDQGALIVHESDLPIPEIVLQQSSLVPEHPKVPGCLPYEPVRQVVKGVGDVEEHLQQLIFCKSRFHGPSLQPHHGLKVNPEPRSRTACPQSPARH